MISERMLKRWRKESLKAMEDIDVKPDDYLVMISAVKELNARILMLTQELLDQHLLREIKKGG